MLDGDVVAMVGAFDASSGDVGKRAMEQIQRGEHHYSEAETGIRGE
jgi:hypothetical protein